jgi:hypothetical protein
MGKKKSVFAYVVIGILIFSMIFTMFSYLIAAIQSV